MKPKDTTDKSQSGVVTFEFDLAHPPKMVWRALTDPEPLARWLLPAIDHSLEPGQAFTFMAPPQPGWDGIVSCRNLDVDPPRTLSYAWTVGDLETIVTFTLAPTDSGTLLRLVQSGFKPGQKNNFGGARYGWRMMGVKLAALLGMED